MTVIELVELLRKFPDEMEVFRADDEHGYGEILYVEERDITFTHRTHFDVEQIKAVMLG